MFLQNGIKQNESDILKNSFRILSNVMLEEKGAAVNSSSPGKGKVNAVMNRQVPSNAQTATISCTVHTGQYKHTMQKDKIPYNKICISHKTLIYGYFSDEVAIY